MRKCLKFISCFLFISTILLISCRKKNNAPDTPGVPWGESSGVINKTYHFATSTSDQDGDSIAIRFSWGDNDTSNWSPFYDPSIESIRDSHAWSVAGLYYIKAQAKDNKEAISRWSAPHAISISFGGWTKTFGGIDDDFGNSVQQTFDGGYIIVGTTESFGAGGADIYLVKTNTNGNAVWTKTFGGTNYDYGYSVRQTSDGGYIIAGKASLLGTDSVDFIYLIKTDVNGDSIWARIYIGAYIYAQYFVVQQTSDGGYIIAGTTGSGANTDVYLVKTYANGDTVWTRTFGGINDDYGYSVQQTIDGGYIIAGTTETFGSGTYDVYLIKTNSDGDATWTKSFGGANWDIGYSVQQTTDGGYIIAGVTASFGAGLYDFYLIKTDANGNSIWTKTYGSNNDDYGKSVQQTIDGGYIIAGHTYSLATNDIDVYLIKADANGNQVWTKTFGGTEWDGANSIQQTSDGGYIIVGTTESFGAGNEDIYLIKTDANGNVN